LTRDWSARDASRVRRRPASLDRHLELLEDVFACVLLGTLVLVCPVLWIVAVASDAPLFYRFAWLVLAITISGGVLWAAVVQLATLIRWSRRRGA
jgi:hypothetical protein